MVLLSNGQLSTVLCAGVARPVQDSERSESGKAAAAAAVGGLAGYLPFFLLTGSSAGLQGLLSLGAAVAGCVLFGVTYRYAVRQDEDNLQVGEALVGWYMSRSSRSSVANPTLLPIRCMSGANLQ